MACALINTPNNCHPLFHISAWNTWAYKYIETIHSSPHKFNHVMCQLNREHNTFSWISSMQHSYIVYILPMIQNWPAEMPTPLIPIVHSSVKSWHAMYLWNGIHTSDCIGWGKLNASSIGWGKLNISSIGWGKLNTSGIGWGKLNTLWKHLG